jgi:hypothetical protein
LSRLALANDELGSQVEILDPYQGIQGAVSAVLQAEVNLV